MSQLIFGGMIAIILLGFYVWSIVDAVSVVQCMKSATADKPCTEVFSNNMSYILNTLGALISSTVVGVLGATKPSEFPVQKILTNSLKGTLTGTIQTIAALMPSIFILVWIVCGVITVIYGFVLSDTDLVAPFSAAAKAWFGVAIAAVYAYFGIRPSNGNNPPNGG